LRTNRDYRWPATLVSACILAAWLFALVDAIRRSGWQLVPIARHVAGVVALYALTGAVLGAVAWLVIGLERRLSARIARSRPRAERFVRAGFYALIAGASSANTAFRTFSGQGISKSAIALWAPYVAIALVSLCAGAFVILLLRLRAAIERGRRIGPSLVVLFLISAAGAVMYVDLTVFVALYSRLHAALEASAFVVLACVIGVGLDVWSSRRRAGAHLVRGLALLGCAWLLLSVVVSPVRSWRDRALRHVWLDPGYAGRALSRVRTVESFLANPLAWRGVTESRMRQLEEMYDISSTALSPAWDEPLAEPPALRKKIDALRGARRDYNVLVYYVDTLRQDVASDPTIMPHAVDFAKQSLEFRRAYAPGSDTLHSLPGITSGSYEHAGPADNDVLRVARRAKLETVLVIPQSAHEFLAKLRPDFEFDRRVLITDYRPQQGEVWGYGADLPTGERLVDRTLEWLREKRQGRFFLWLFNFDQHNWREVDKDWVHAVAVKYSVPDDGLLNWRYRVVATAIDREFRRLLDGLEQLGLEDDTIVVFISDHGEGLGRDGFWVHSVFLWDSLVRAPLVIRVPGMGHRVVYDKVSLVDFAPTIARFLVDDPDTRGYQGEDLISYLVPDRPPRRLPLLLAAVAQENLVRIGIVDPKRDWKLVLPLESGAPELYDLSVSDPDWLSVAEEHPTEVARLLSQLVRSPLYPRSANDVAARQRERAAAATKP
jgi:uncharacterized protein